MSSRSIGHEDEDVFRPTSGNAMRCRVIHMHISLFIKRRFIFLLIRTATEGLALCDRRLEKRALPFH